MFKFGKFFLAPLALAALTAGSAMAVPTLMISGDNGVTFTTVTDQSGADTSSVVGRINWSGLLNGWDIGVSIGNTKPNSGTAAVPSISLSVQADTAGARQGANSLVVMFSDTVYTADPFQAQTSAGITGPGTAVDSFFYSASNTLFDTAGGTYRSASLPVAGNAPLLTGPAILGLSPFSLTLRAVIQTSEAGTTQDILSLRAVPEPGFYGLLSLGLSGVFFLAHRRRSQAKQ
jgi:hypothetical protein